MTSSLNKSGTNDVFEGSRLGASANTSGLFSQAGAQVLTRRGFVASCAVASAAAALAGGAASTAWAADGGGSGEEGSTEEETAEDGSLQVDATDEADAEDALPLTSTDAEPEGELALDMSAWNYDADNDVYWQVGAAYCTDPQLADYESMGLYVPGAYLFGEENGDGTYTCTRNDEGAAGDFTAATAPIVIPVNTAGYAAQAAPTSYSYDSVSAYLEAGFIYVYPGCRGRDNGESDDGSIAYAGGAPWGVTDLKAAVRCLRYNSAVLPGDFDAIFTFGHSGGGAQSSLMGASGDSELYKPYLETIGAAMEDAAGQELSDSIAGAMCWCPITCLDEADAAYEWQMGQFADDGTREEGSFTAQLSQDLAAAYAQRVNELGFTLDGEELSLEESDEGVWLSGSYADAVLAAIEESLNNFLEDTEFPYTPSSSEMSDGGFGGGLTDDADASGDLPDGDIDADGGLDLDDGVDLDGDLPDGDVDLDGDLPDGTTRGASSASRSSLASATASTASSDTYDAIVDGDVDTLGLDEGIAAISELDDLDDADDTDAADDADADSTTYDTAQAYIDSLNADEDWIDYDEDSNTATVASLGAFAIVCKAPTKDVGAFDAFDLSQAENKVFSDGDVEARHFDRLMADLLSANAASYADLEDWDEGYPKEYEADLAEVDSVGLSVEERCDLYNPLYFLLESSEGFGSSTPAPHWRIRSGITQGDTALTTELNLALALQACEAVEDVDFATVWGQGHTTAERTGDADENFIAWVEECVLGVSQEDEEDEAESEEGEEGEGVDDEEAAEGEAAAEGDSED